MNLVISVTKVDLDLEREKEKREIEKDWIRWRTRAEGAGGRKENQRKRIVYLI